MQPKPKHLGAEYGATFKDKSVVDAYRFRPSHSAELFDILDSLIIDRPRIVLDVGCGTGNIARPLAGLVDRVDAVDFSQHMLDEAKRLPNGDASNLNWIYGAVEEVPLSPPYALVTAGQSLHWMAWDVVLPRFQKMLIPGGFLAIIDMNFSSAPWDEALGQLISRYSTNQDFRPYNLIAELEQRGLFTKVGEKQTTPQSFKQTAEAYIESFHSRNGFSRQRMTPETADAFDAAVYDLVTQSYPNGIFEVRVSGQVTWGFPRAIP